jgi:hypothetical protein
MKYCRKRHPQGFACELPSGHDGPHRCENSSGPVVQATGAVVWSDDQADDQAKGKGKAKGKG